MKEFRDGKSASEYLVRVSKEMVDQLLDKESEPVVLIKLEKYADGTHVMWLQTPEARHDKLREALAFYADPATWDTVGPHGTVTMNTPARRDGGDLARGALDA